MKVETRLTGTWRNRMLFIAVMIIGFGAWFFYDGLVGWPAEQERYLVYDEIATRMIEAGEAGGRDSLEVKRAWKAEAEARGWNGDKTPKERTEEKIAAQLFPWGSITAGVGLVFLGWILWNQTLNVRSDDQFVYGTNKKGVPWEAFTGMDRSKWEKKGIAVALYQEDGKEKRLVLDDYKFAGAEAIILEIERRLGIEYVPPAIDDASAEETAEAEPGEAPEKKS